MNFGFILILLNLPTKGGSIKSLGWHVPHQVISDMNNIIGCCNGCMRNIKIFTYDLLSWPAVQISKTACYYTSLIKTLLF